VSRAYLRVAPQLYERKVIEQEYPLPLFAAFVGMLCLAEHQPNRGRFRDVRVLRALLGPAGRWVPELVSRGDIVFGKDGTVYVDGWDEWQEGDVTVGERVKRIRTRRRATPATVTPVTVPTVDTPLSGSGGVSGGVTPPPQAGRRADGTNPRAVGTNPRANGTSPRQERERVKRDPTPIHEILRRSIAAGHES
jgi:hypothetical protein